MHPTDCARHPLCSAGTPLGDPIEVGAALAVLSGPDRRAPLGMVASKSWVGHAEPGAGLVGLVFAQQSVVQRATLPIMHLRSVNAYVATSLESKAGSSVLLPKQMGALTSGHAEPADGTYGVSAFAYQGTNAHALLKPAASLADGQAWQQPAARLPWRGQRHFVLPELSQLLHSVHIAAHAAGGSEAVFHCNLSAVQLAYLWDHQVLGKSIFPGEPAQGMGSAHAAAAGRPRAESGMPPPRHPFFISAYTTQALVTSRCAGQGCGRRSMPGSPARQSWRRPAFPPRWCCRHSRQPHRPWWSAP